MISQNRPLTPPGKRPTTNPPRGRLFWPWAIALGGVSNVLSEEKKAQVIALGRLG